MRNCDLYTGANRIRKSLEAVAAVWDQASQDWNDGVSDKFNQHHIEPLLPEVKLALDAIGRMQRVMGRSPT